MDSLFFVSSKIIWMLAKPESLLLLLSTIGLIALWANARRTAIILITSATGFSLLIALLPLGDLVLKPLETRFPNNPQLSEISGIIVLGGAEQAGRSKYWQQPQLSTSGERLVEAVALAHRFPDAKLAYLGGSGSIFNQDDKGAGVAETIFLSLSIEKKRLVIESHSRNTYENAKLGYEMIKPTKVEKWVLVTSAFHMARSIGVFCGVGWPVIPYPVDYFSGSFLQKPGINFAHNLENLNIGAKEWLGLLAYRLTDKIPTLFPNTC